MAKNPFTLITCFDFVVPANYEHDTQISDFTRRTKSRLGQYQDPGLTDANFKNTTARLVPSESYTARLIGVQNETSCQDCIDYLRSKNSIFVSAQGLTLISETCIGKLPKARTILSFDLPEALWVDQSGDVRVPDVYCYHGNYEHYNLMCLWGHLDSNYCFFDISAN